MATSEGIPSSIDIEFLELNDNPYTKGVLRFPMPKQRMLRGQNARTCLKSVCCWKAEGNMQS